MGMVLVVGLVFVAVGIWAAVWAGRRAFERTNAAGVQEFKSYGSAVKSTAVEGLAKTAAVLAILFGAFLMLVGAIGMGK